MFFWTQCMCRILVYFKNLSRSSDSIHIWPSLSSLEKFSRKPASFITGGCFWCWTNQQCEAVKTTCQIKQCDVTEEHKQRNHLFTRPFDSSVMWLRSINREINHLFTRPFDSRACLCSGSVCWCRRFCHVTKSKTWILWQHFLYLLHLVATLNNSQWQRHSSSLTTAAVSASCRFCLQQNFHRDGAEMGIRWGGDRHDIIVTWAWEESERDGDGVKMTEMGRKSSLSSCLPTDLHDITDTNVFKKWLKTGFVWSCVLTYYYCCTVCWAAPYKSLIVLVFVTENARSPNLLFVIRWQLSW